MQHKAFHSLLRNYFQMSGLYIPEKIGFGTRRLIIMKTLILLFCGII